VLNIAILMGRLVADPDLKQTPNGISLATARLAVERRYKSANGERESDFINIAAWRNTGEFLSRYFRKGDMVAVQGPIQTRNYVDRDGINRTSVEVVADQVSFCGGKQQTITYVPPVSGDPEEIEEFEEIIDDDLPFA